MESGYSLFKTSLGLCGIAWGERGITGLALPSPREEETVKRLSGGGESDTGGLARRRPPPPVADAMRRIARHLSGKLEDLSSVAIDLSGVPPFHRRVYQAARAVEPGRVVTYGELAARAGSPGASRAVGQAMARNRFPLVVPCHRVMGSLARPVGFSAYGGCGLKLKLLALEGWTPPVSLFNGRGRPGFDLQEAVRRIGEADPPLGSFIRRFGAFGLKPQSLHSPYEALARAIIYQQLNGRAAATILARVKGLNFAGRFPAPEELLATPEESLRKAGLSRGKLAALRDLAARTVDGTVPSLREIRSLSDEEVIRRLDPIRGIGRWTVEMLLIFRLGRPDVLPADDFGVRKGLARILGKKKLPTPRETLRRGERWRPFRTVATWYLWRACEE